MLTTLWNFLVKGLGNAVFVFLSQTSAIKVKRARGDNPDFLPEPEPTNPTSDFENSYNYVCESHFTFKTFICSSKCSYSRLNSHFQHSPDLCPNSVQTGRFRSVYPQTECGTVHTGRQSQPADRPPHQNGWYTFSSTLNIKQ